MIDKRESVVGVASRGVKEAEKRRLNSTGPSLFPRLTSSAGLESMLPASVKSSLQCLAHRGFTCHLAVGRRQ